MEVTLKFILPEEEELLKEALMVGKYASSLWKIREQLDSFLNENHLTLREVSTLGCLRQLIPEDFK